jgi:penicillin-binding protein 1A
MIDERKKNIIKEVRSSFLSFFVWCAKFIVFLVSFTLIGFLICYLYFSEGLPKISTLKDYKPSVITTVYSDDNTKLSEFFEERRIVIKFEDMPKMLINAFVATEDARFFNHQGVDFFSIIRAFVKNIEAGAIVQGGSTITQQVAKSFFLTPEKSYSRKIKEAILAYRIDKKFTKEEILYLYLNQIYLGHGAYGVEAAANNYFGKTAKEMNLAECAIFGGLPKAPNRYSPFRNLKRAKTRQLYVLNRMAQEKYITNKQADEAYNKELDIKPRENLYLEISPHYSEYVRRYIEQKYGRETLYREGLKVYTAVNADMQKMAEQEVKKGLIDIDKRQGFRGPLKNISLANLTEFFEKEKFPETIEEGDILQALIINIDDDDKTADVLISPESLGIIEIDDVRWARAPDTEVVYYEAASIKAFSDILKIGDVILVKVKKWIEEEELWELSLEQMPIVQSSLLCIEAGAGLVKAMIGGFDFTKSEFNRAIQARRQPGSAFKPVIYSAAIDKGYTPSTVLIDNAIVYQDEETDIKWKPRNYSEQFSGNIMLREAFAKSRNVVTIKILRDIGIEYVVDYAKKLGIESPLAPDLSLALGTSGTSLLELTSSYSVFANNGYKVKPIFITKITDRNGNILEENFSEKEKVIEESTAYMMTSLLQSVITHGTGWRVKRGLKRPAAGKTGTTDNLHDAWFVGYTPRYITGVWVGFDEEASLGKGETGSRSASPIWLGFMKRVLEDKPVKAFQVPKEVVFAKIDAETGLLPNPESKNVVMECFKEGTVPTEYSKKKDIITDMDKIFKLDIE